MSNKALFEIAKELEYAVSELEKDSVKAHVLKDADKKICNIVQSNYMDDSEALFLMFFYNNFRNHLWAHIAAGASIRMKDEQATDILEEVCKGLKKLASSLYEENDEKVYKSLVSLTERYLKILDIVDEKYDR